VTAPALGAPSRTGTVADLVGRTPLLRLGAIAPDLPAGIEVHAKAEHLNPGGSVKDRAALAMIRAAEASGALTPDVRIADATSGNTGIALAMLASALGYGVTLALPANANEARRRTLEALGAELILTDPMEGSDGAINAIRALVAASPERFCYLDQYSNPANPRAHETGTAPEIWEQTAGRVTHFVAALGTTGTFTGTTRGLRAHSAAIECIALQPDGPYHALDGVKHLPTAEHVPSIYDPALADRVVTVGSEIALDTMHELARVEGLLVGPSAAANVTAAIAVARELASSGVDEAIVVTIICDGAAKYLSEPIWTRA
jgi:S-sulfo-L-cysteine synthase (O-acetyl-L-serine-dependent)